MQRKTSKTVLVLEVYFGCFKINSKMIQYKNICKFLETCFKVETSLVEFQSTKNITFTCLKKNHSNTLNAASFINKKSKHTRENKDLEDFCQGCIDAKDNDQHFEECKQSIFDNCGHLLVELNRSTRNCVYVCCNCGSNNNSHISNLQKNKGNCPNCQNEQFRISYDKLKQDVESHGFQLLTKPEDYKSNKQKLDVICKCGEKYETYLVSIRQDKHCKNCKTEKSEQTCLEKYNERNVMHVDSIFYKVQTTNPTNKEYVFPKSGRKVVVQGCENFAIEFLLNNINKVLNRQIQEDEIEVGNENIPTFKYMIEDIEHKYYPDIFIKNTNFVIESKMVEIFNRQGPEKNYKKFEAVVANGYNLMVIIFNNRNELYDIWYFLVSGQRISILKNLGKLSSFCDNLSCKNFEENIIDEHKKLSF